MSKLPAQVRSTQYYYHCYYTCIVTDARSLFLFLFIYLLGEGTGGFHSKRKKSNQRIPGVEAEGLERFHSSNDAYVRVRMKWLFWGRDLPVCAVARRG